MTMTPFSLRNYLRAHKICSMQELVTVFKTTAENLRPLLEMWMNKKKVICRSRGIMCGKQCVKCHPLMIEIYEWIEKGNGSVQSDLAYNK